jgi:hypothetical protein
MSGSQHYYYQFNTTADFPLAELPQAAVTTLVAQAGGGSAIFLTPSELSPAASSKSSAGAADTMSRGEDNVSPALSLPAISLANLRSSDVP